jgi:hypothetical protein
MKSLTPPIGVQIYTQFLNLQNFLAKFSIYPPPTTAIGLSVASLLHAQTASVLCSFREKAIPLHYQQNVIVWQGD